MFISFNDLDKDLAADLPYAAFNGSDAVPRET